MMVCTPMPTIEVFHGVGDGATLESLAAYENFGRPVVSERKERDFFREISWDSLGPSSTDNLAGLYYPTASLLKEMPDEACKIVADAASCAEINQRESAWRPRTRCLRLTHPNV